MTKKGKILDLRKEGLKYKEIADQVGCSVQYVAQICSKGNPGHFRFVGDDCVYPNLRKWMNENKVSRKEFLRRMGLTTHPSNYERFCWYVKGKSFPRKDYIDKMLSVTGLTYETMFGVSQDGCEQ